VNVQEIFAAKPEFPFLRPTLRSRKRSGKYAGAGRKNSTRTGRI
jgi:hypothetical protein